MQCVFLPVQPDQWVSYRQQKPFFKMNQTTAIAISGGIDSLVAAYLLKKQGHNIFGVHFITGFEKDSHESSTFTTDDKSIVLAAEKFSHIEKQLGIEIKILDCRNEFKTKIVDYFTKSYFEGNTPNPCLVCNPTIKFGAVLKYAEESGATSLATGHYARIKKDDSGIYHLLKGVDPSKDQSYFLSFLSQKKLSRACFPLGEMKKSEVIKFAEKKGLEPIMKQESQDICFITGKTYGEFLSHQSDFEQAPGLIENIHGDVIGNHKGLHLFTIGQRRGINCPASEPYYVIKIDVAGNRLVVGFKNDLFKTECRVTGINWINKPPERTIKVSTRIRYSHMPVESIITHISDTSADIKFSTPQAAITPGQGAVFYTGDEVIGGGWIKS